MPDHLGSNVALQKLREFDPTSVEDAQVFRNEVTIFIRADRLVRVCEFLRDTPGLLFKFLVDVTALDYYPDEPRFQTVYHLLSLETGARLRLKVRISGEDPRVDSVLPVWPAAEAYENEIYDMFGIHFDGHPDLRRILMPEDWEGYPLRKDYPIEGYR